MHRLWVALVAILGFVVGFAAAFVVGVHQTLAPECDGPCFDEWNGVLHSALRVGVVAALAAAVVTAALLSDAS